MLRVSRTDPVPQKEPWQRGGSPVRRIYGPVGNLPFLRLGSSDIQEKKGHARSSFFHASLSRFLVQSPQIRCQRKVWLLQEGPGNRRIVTLCETEAFGRKGLQLRVPCKFKDGIA